MATKTTGNAPASAQTAASPAAETPAAGASVKLPQNPAIPLQADLLAQYKALYDQYESAIRGTTDTNLLDSLLDQRDEVGAVLEANDDYILAQNTANYEQVLTQIGIANKGMADVKAQIEKIAKDIGRYAAVLATINKILGMVPLG